MNVSKISGAVSAGVKNVAKNANAPVKNELAAMYLKRITDNRVMRYPTKEDIRNLVMWELAMKRINASAETIEKMFAERCQEWQKLINRPLK